MKNLLKIITNAFLVLIIMGSVPFVAAAQTSTTTDDTASAVAAGQQISQQLQSKQISCSSLSDTNYENLGEYFMNQMMGSSHEQMNEYVVSRFGQSGEEQMHVAMGKRLSGCDTNAAYPSWMQGFMPMMSGGYGMMGGYGSNYYGSNYQNNMMGYYGYGSMMGWGGLGLLFNILWWVLIVAVIIGLVRLFSGKSGRWGRGSALDILKERYAKGEIDKAEFEAKKKDLNA
jgi:putative membrane protein